MRPPVQMLAAPSVLFLFTIRIVLATAGQRVPRAPSEYRAYWNVPTFGCHRYGMPFNVSEPWGFTQNAGDEFRGEQFAILYDPGEFPALVPNAQGQKRNGGVPQEGDLQRHLAALANDVEKLVPDVNFSGLGVLDMESWRPVWRQLFGSFKMYKEFSRDIERRRHPTWSSAQIEQSASSRFEAGAREFMETSLQLVRQMRPRASWGYYAFPYCFNTKGNDCSAEVKAENDRIQWLFDASGALFPSVYFGSQSPLPEDREAFIRWRVKEAQRVASQTPRLSSPPVYAYMRYNYYDTSDFLSPESMKISLHTPQNLEANGIVVWGSWNDVKTEQKCVALEQYVDNVLGPLVKNLTQ